MQEKEGVVKYQCRFTRRALRYDISELNSWRRTLYLLQLVGGGNPSRYNGVGFGNLSQRIDTDSPRHKRRFIITGTQTGELPNLARQHYTLVREHYPEQNLVVAEGTIEPSSESMTHGAIYDISGHIRFVFHVHSPDIWRCARRLAIPTTGRNVEYGTPEMAEEIGRLFRETSARKMQIISMGGHEDGIVSFGKTAEGAGKVLINYFVEALKLTKNKT